MSNKRKKRALSLTEESGPTVTHVSISKPRNRRENRKKQETEYSILPDTVAASRAPTQFSESLPIPPTVDRTTDYAVFNELIPSNSSEFPCDFPSSDGPQLFNGLVDPNATDGAVSDTNLSVRGEEEFLHQIVAKEPTKRGPRVSYLSSTGEGCLLISLCLLQQTALQQWLQFRQEYLDCMMEHEARGHDYVCTQCGPVLETDPIFRCRDCFGGATHCTKCIINQHRRLPFHNIQVSNIW